MPKKRLNEIMAWSVAVLGAVVAITMIRGSLAFFGDVNDLPEYYAGAHLFLHNRAAEIYQLDKFFEVERQLFPMLTRGVALFLPPPAVPLLVPIAMIPLAVAPQVWAGLLCIAFVLALVMLARHFQLGREGLGWLIGLALLSGPAIEGLRIGQLAPLLLLALCLFVKFAAGEKWAPAGVALTLLVLKPQQLFPLVIYLIGAGRNRVLLIAAGIVIALTLITVPFFGIDGYFSYLHAVSNKANLELMRPELNPTVRGQALRLAGLASGLPTMVGLAALLISTIFVFLLGRRWRNKSQWLEVGLCCALPVGLATSMHCHDYDLVLLIPGLVALACGLGTEHKRLGLLVAAATVTFVQPFYSEIHYGYLKYGHPLNPHFIALFVIALSCAWIGWRQQSAVADKQ